MNKSIILDNIVSASIVVSISIGGFWSGMYYSMDKLSQEIQKWSLQYQQVNDNLKQYMKVVDPETTQFYVKKLHDILDDIKFLDNLVSSGQIASESLDSYFKDYQKQLDDANRKLIELYVEVTGSIEQLKTQNNIQYSDIGDNLDLIDSVGTRLKEQIDYVNQLNIDIGQSVKKLKDDVQIIKNSKYGKKIWSENGKNI